MKDKSTKAILLILGLIVLYVLVFLLIHIKAEEQDFKTFEVVTGLSGLLLSIIGSIYVFNAYDAQREQINIQKKEIEDNNSDTEYNRVLDLIYKHNNITIDKLNKLKTYNNNININNTLKYNVSTGIKKFKKLGSELLIINKDSNEFYINGLNFKDFMFYYYNELSFDLKKIKKALLIYNVLITDNSKLSLHHKHILNIIVRDLFFNELQKKYENLLRNNEQLFDYYTLWYNNIIEQDKADKGIEKFYNLANEIHKISQQFIVSLRTKFI